MVSNPSSQGAKEPLLLNFQDKSKNKQTNILKASKADTLEPVPRLAWERHDLSKLFPYS